MAVAGHTAPRLKRLSFRSLLWHSTFWEGLTALVLLAVPFGGTAAFALCFAGVALWSPHIPVWLACLALLAAILFGSPLVLLAGGLRQEWRLAGRWAVLQDTGLFTEGTVRKVQVRYRGRGYSYVEYRVWYSYQDSFGRTYECRSWRISAREGARLRTGTIGLVCFDRANPGFSIWLGPQQ